MSAKPIFSMQIKAKPLICREFDTRPWGVDVYGVHDNFTTPIEDPEGPPLGPPEVITETGDTGRYVPCLLPTLARLQYFNSGSGAWRRLTGDGNGIDVNVVNQAQVSVFALPAQVVGGFSLTTTTVGAVSTLIGSPTGGSSYMRVDVVAGAGNLWVNLSGAAAALNTGVLVTPTSPLILEWPNAPNTDIFAIATAVGTVCNVSIRG